MVVIDEYSLTAIPLTMLCNDKEIGTATGFFHKSGDKFWIISNWHVFSGRNPITGQSLRKDAALPDAIRLWLHIENKMGSVAQQKVALVDAAGEPIWRQHKRGQDYDVAVLRVGTLPKGCIAYDLPRPRETGDMGIKIGMDAYILGFPKGIANNKILPIWKRGSIASEPELPHDDKPLFLLDTATREGMSGAPVLLRTFGGYHSTDGNQNLVVGASTRFVGIYSGRYVADDEFGAQLGRVWHRSVIDQVIADGVKGSYELRGDR